MFFSQNSSPLKIPDLCNSASFPIWSVIDSPTGSTEGFCPWRNAARASRIVWARIALITAHRPLHPRPVKHLQVTPSKPRPCSLM